MQVPTSKLGWLEHEGSFEIAQLKSRKHPSGVEQPASSTPSHSLLHSPKGQLPRQTATDCAASVTGRKHAVTLSAAITQRNRTPVT